MSGPPLLLVAGHEVVHASLARAHILESELRQKLRLAVVGSLGDVQCVVLERNRGISVIRAGAPLDASVIGDVAGYERALRGRDRRAAPWRGRSAGSVTRRLRWPGRCPQPARTRLANGAATFASDRKAWARSRV